MTLTDREKRLVTGVLEELLRLKYDDLNKMFGSLTIEDMHKLYSKLQTEDYCKRAGVKYEDLDEFDWENIYRERWEA